MSLDLRKLGFKTGKVVLPGLGLETRLEPGQYFRNDGVVDNFNRHYAELARELGCPEIRYLPYRQNNKDVDIKGTTIQLDGKARPGNERVAVIFLRDNGHPYNIFYNGHEAVHAIILFGKQKEFTDYVMSQGFNLDPFKVFDEEEHVADIGGLVSLHRRGKDDYFRMPVPRFVLEAFLDSRKKKVTSVYR